MFANLHLTSTNEVKFFFSSSFVHFNNEQWSYEPINLKGPWVKGPVYLRISTTQKPIKENMFPTVSEFYNINILKSSIQKCVRRMRAESVVRLSLQMMIQDFDAYIRRLPVILVEDSVLDHCGYSFIIWMMVASCNGWKPTRAQIIRVLEIVYLATLSRYHDHPAFNWNQKFINKLITKHLTKDEEVIEEEKDQEKEKQKQKQKETETETETETYKIIQECTRKPKLNWKQQALLGTFLIRAAYGGREGDQYMFMGAVVTWHHRFQNSPESWYRFLGSQYSIDCYEKIMSIVPLFSEQITPKSSSNTNSSTISKTNLLPCKGKTHLKRILKPCDKFKEAIDYMCVGQVLDQLKLRINNKFTDKELKNAIWYHRSGKHFKKFVIDRSNLYNAPNFPTNEDKEISDHEKVSFECYNYIEQDFEDIVQNSSWWEPASFYQKAKWEKNKRKRFRFDPKQRKITDFFQTKSEEKQVNKIEKSKQYVKVLDNQTHSNKLLYKNLKIKRIKKERNHTQPKKSSNNTQALLPQSNYNLPSKMPMGTGFITASKLLTLNYKK
ncbi:hypothetical protein M0813_12417 [Anaeramoeba flamelloides]|uniref:Uncharacterized protein n=1 Tax=Anaeramoeba flamelloides TaxID=1746091 RepID=A0ABQ8ZCP4_9EUKA|nr:hypothetical protein M0813_12417 [Anaeramoeba flamelloides]